jgi:DNA-binding transcriptional MocR family regulator
MHSKAKKGGAWSPRQLSSKGARYLAVVQALEQDIGDRRLCAGDRLPPHRELAKLLNLSVGTVAKAYDEAEQRGIIDSHVGRGTFVRQENRGALVNRGGALDLSLNVPVAGSEAQIQSKLLQEIAHSKDFASLSEYGPHGGHSKHREIISNYISTNGMKIEPNKLFLCNGAQHAIDIALRLVVGAGEAVITEALTYSGFKAIAAANRLELSSVEIDNEGMVPGSLERVARETRAKVIYTMPTLHSPTARTMSAKRRQAIIEIAERLDLWIIEDDVYGFFNPQRPLTLCELAPHRTFYITSFSKYVAPGFRLGTLTVPTVFSSDVDLLLHASTWFVAPLLSEMAVRLIESGQMAKLTAERRAQASERYGLFQKLFVTPDRINFPCFFGWLPLPKEWPSLRFATMARNLGIIVTPPVASTVNDGEAGGVRVCLGAPKDLNSLSSALMKLRHLLETEPAEVFSVA